MLGQTISHYRILEKLGEGGMGVVYRAEDTKLHRPVALKFLSPEMTRDETAKKRFLQEARSVSSLDHPNIAVVHEVDETADGQAFICMAYYDGLTVKQRLEQGPLEIEESVRIAYQIADGLERAHEAGIVHRDIKPANIIITERGEAKIVDFGIARLADETKLRGPTETGGTAAYMSPEQAQGGAADHRSDLFSLGIVLYEMATRQKPFQGEHEAAVLYSIVNADPAAPSQVQPGVSKELDRVILRLLEKNPDRRYQSAAEVRNDLGGFLGIAPGRVVVRPTRGNRILRILIPLLGIAAIVALIPQARDYIGGKLRSLMPPSYRTVVILPFISLGDDSLSRDLSAGLTSTLTSSLSQVGHFGYQLGVVPASSVRESKIRTPEEARDKFAATHAIEGTVQLIGSDIRVTVNYIDAAGPVLLNSDVRDYAATDLARIQDQSSERVAGFFGITVVESLKAAFAAVGTKSSDAFRYYARGRSYLERHESVVNIDLAIGLFRRALVEDSLYGLAYAGLGEAYWRKYQRTRDLQWVEPATGACVRALHLAPQLAETRVTLGLVSQGKGDYEQALREYRRALELNARTVDALIGMGRAFEELGRSQEADSAYRRAIAEAPGYWDAYNSYGVFLLYQGRSDEAIAQFRLVTDLAPDNHIGYSNLGGALMMRNQWEEAKEAYAKSLDLVPNATAYSNLGTIYFYSDADYGKAAHAYEQALRLREQDYVLWGNLGAARLQLPGMANAAAEAYRRAIEIAMQHLRVNPNDVSIMGALATFHASVGNRAPALRYAKRVAEEPEPTTESIQALVETYELLGMRSDALAWLEKGTHRGLNFELLERSPELADLVADSAYRAIRMSAH